MSVKRRQVGKPVRGRALDSAKRVGIVDDSRRYVVAGDSFATPTHPQKRAGYVVQSVAKRLLYPVNGHLILNLILTLINWVEGRLNFTYVESISDTSQICPFPVNSRPLYH